MYYFALYFLLLLVFSGAIIRIYNQFVKNRNRVKDAWSNIDIAFKKRFDLIPNLVNTVKGYANHEQHTLSRIIELRNATIAIPKEDIPAQINAQNMLSKQMGSILALAESYPNLKADSSFLNLQNQLADIEELLERSRRYYNSMVRENNTYGESFPGVLFASLFKYQSFSFFEIQVDEKENIPVNF